MSYNVPTVGEIVVVPLVHPNGAYIRLDNDVKVPVLAKVRSTFGSTANVINFFGYIYNVPFSHTERINYGLQTKFYTDVITNAQRVMESFGYRSLDNSEFYKTAPNINSYPFLPHLPGYRTNVVNPFENKPIIINISSDEEREERNREERNREEREEESDLGSIRIMDVDKENVLHVINKTNGTINYDKKTSELNINGYCTFLIDSTHTYTPRDSSKEYIIFESQRNYIHVRKSKVTHGSTGDVRKSREVRYSINTLKLKKHESTHKKYFNIIKVIDKEFD